VAGEVMEGLAMGMRGKFCVLRTLLIPTIHNPNPAPLLDHVVKMSHFMVVVERKCEIAVRPAVN